MLKGTRTPARIGLGDRPYLDVAVGGAGDEVLLGGVERHAANGRIVCLERVLDLTLSDVKDADVAALAAADEHLVLRRVEHRR